MRIIKLLNISMLRNDHFLANFKKKVLI